MIRTISGTIAVVAFLIMKFSGIELSNVGTTSVPAVGINRSIGDTYNAFVDGSKLASDLGKLSDARQITVTLDPNKSITYRISSTIDSDGSTIKIIFGTVSANNTTISADIDVADVRQGNKYISEEKVQKMLKDDINAIAYALNKNTTDEAKMRDINVVLISLAALTNAKTEAEADKLVQGIAERSMFDEEPQNSVASNQTVPTKSFTKFGEPTGITGAPSVPLPSSGESDAASTAQESADYAAEASDSEESQ
jgi:hypothetical protein